MTLPSDKEHPDYQLFRRFCAGESDATKKIYQDAYPVIKKLITKNTGYAEDAQDVFQEMLLVLLLKYCPKKNFLLTTRLTGLLYGIGRNLWLKKLEKKGRSGITFHDIEEYVDMKYPLRLEQEENLKAHRFYLLWKHITKLEDKEQKVLKLYYLEGKSHREIAAIMEFADEVSARVQKYRYLKKLRKLTRQDPDFE